MLLYFRLMTYRFTHCFEIGKGKLGIVNEEGILWGFKTNNSSNNNIMKG